MSPVTALERVEVSAMCAGSEEILSAEALSFIASLHREFDGPRTRLLEAREKRQQQLDSGVLPDFPRGENASKKDWKVGKIPDDLLDRRVEITGPAGDTKMVINALNSGASTYMADFEDSQSPTWNEIIRGQINLRDVVEGTIRYVSPEGKVYRLNDKVATLIVRPRGWHLQEKHLLVDGRPVSASLFDFGLFLFHNAEKLVKNASGPYFYLPKLENHLEAGLWEHVFSRAEDYIGLRRGTIKATVLIETILAAFEMDEILYELRDHVVGLNCGRWDYIFSYIKKLRAHPQFLLPNRAQVTMDKGFLSAYVKLLIKTCHKRGAYAIGGMSAYIPVKGDEAANEIALRNVRADKEREATLGHDGTWVAHPGLVKIAREVFDSKMPGPNQLHVVRDEWDISREDLLAPPPGTITEDGIRTNIAVGLRYLESWLDGRGCVPINNLMEDAATAEISRAQLWQWIRHSGRLHDGRTVTPEMVRLAMAERIFNLFRGRDAASRALILAAGELFERLANDPSFPEFMTLPAYDLLVAQEEREI